MYVPVLDHPTWFVGFACETQRALDTVASTASRLLQIPSQPRVVVTLLSHSAKFEMLLRRTFMSNFTRVNLGVGFGMQYLQMHVLKRASRGNCKTSIFVTFDSIPLLLEQPETQLHNLIHIGDAVALSLSQGL